MKSLFVSTALLLTTLTSTFAGENIVFSAEKKRTGSERERTVSTQVSSEKWAYHITLENKSFKDLAGVEVRYVVFVKADVAGSATGQSKESKTKGSQKMETFKNNSKFEFDTEGVDLKKTELIGGWTYGNGAKSRAKAGLSGIWIRVFQNGAQIAEYSEPESLKTKEKW